MQAAFLLEMYGWHLCLRRCRLPHAKNACIPHTPYTLVLEFVLPAGGVCGAATHAVGGDVGYGLLFRTSMQLQTRQRIRLAVYRNRVFFQAALGSGFQLPLCPIGKVIPFEVFQPEFVV